MLQKFCHPERSLRKLPGCQREHRETQGPWLGAGVCSSLWDDCILLPFLSISLSLPAACLVCALWRTSGLLLASLLPLAIASASASASASAMPLSLCLCLCLCHCPRLCLCVRERERERERQTEREREREILTEKSTTLRARAPSRAMISQVQFTCAITLQQARRHKEPLCLPDLPGDLQILRALPTQ